MPRARPRDVEDGPLVGSMATSAPPGRGHVDAAGRVGDDRPARHPSAACGPRDGPRQVDDVDAIAIGVGRHGRRPVEDAQRAAAEGGAARRPDRDRPGRGEETGGPTSPPATIVRPADRGAVRADRARARGACGADGSHRSAADGGSSCDDQGVRTRVRHVTPPGGSDEQQACHHCLLKSLGSQRKCLQRSDSDAPNDETLTGRTWMSDIVAAADNLVVLSGRSVLRGHEKSSRGAGFLIGVMVLALSVWERLQPSPRRWRRSPRPTTRRSSTALQSPRGSTLAARARPRQGGHDGLSQQEQRPSSTWRSSAPRSTSSLASAPRPRRAREGSPPRPSGRRSRAPRRPRRPGLQADAPARRL